MSQAILPDLAILPLIEDLHKVLLSGMPLLDVRAPVEFIEGSLPAAQNLPLMTDTERMAVGTCYKQKGQDAAIELGLQLVSGAVKAERVAEWAQFVQQHPEGALYCFRGGLRSRIAQQWIYQQTGQLYPRVQGGYKALRRYVLDQLELLPTRYQSFVLSGRTGSGKTRFLATLRQQIDLEGLANHRGSAFGPQVTPQPGQVDFENVLAVHLLRQLEAGVQALVFEDESRNIGSIHIPAAVFAALGDAPLVMLQVDDDERVQISYQEYVVDMTTAFEARHPDDPEAGFLAFSDYLLGSLGKIKRRLGGVRYAEILSIMQTALAIQQRSGETEAHREWVRTVLLDYYDPMYDYQLSKKQPRLVFRGNTDEVREYLASQGIT